MEQQPNNLFDLIIDQPSSIYLQQSARWAKFLAIIGFIFCGFFLILCLVNMLRNNLVFESFGLGSVGSAGTTAFSGPIISIIYILFTAVAFLPCLYLFRFSSRMNAALAANDQDALSTAFKNLKSCFRFYGIIMIVILAIYAVLIVIGIIALFMR
jgi:Family of unknown function (DUF5362)